MKTKPIILTAIAFLFVSVSFAQAQHEGHAEHKAPARRSPKKPPAQKSKATPRSVQTNKPASQASEQQETHHHDSSAMNMTHMNMTQGTHPALAMAYVQSIATFAKALRDQVETTKSVDPEFAFGVVDEMKRSLDNIEQHHQDHKMGDPAGTKSQMDTMAKEMETKMSALRQSISALEQEIQAGAPATSQVLQRADEIIRLAGEMSKSHNEHKEHSK